jgi:hypothetical protein
MHFFLTHRSKILQIRELEQYLGDKKTIVIRYNTDLTQDHPRRVLERLLRQLERQYPRTKGNVVYEEEEEIIVKIFEKCNGDTSWEEFLDKINEIDKNYLQNFKIKQKIAILRKYYYDSHKWDMLIPGSKSIKNILKEKKINLEKNICIGGYKVDFGHILTVLDAHNSSNFFTYVAKTPNYLIAGWVGDLASVIESSIKQKINLQESVDNYAAPEDLLGDILGEVINSIVTYNKDLTLDGVFALISAYDKLATFPTQVTRYFKDIMKGTEKDIRNTTIALVGLKSVQKIFEDAEKLYTAFKRGLAVAKKVKQHI